MKKYKDAYLISKTYFRLLPIQILLALVPAVNGTVSGLFGSNFIGPAVMSAIGLYAPIVMFLAAASMVFVGGTQILCGKYMGKNEPEKTQDIFILSLLTVTGFSLVMCIILSLCVFTDLTRIFTSDPVIREPLNKYILGQVVGLLPWMLGLLLPAFLSLENQSKRTTTAGIVCILVNVLCNFLFVVVLKMGVFGLSLASSAGMWALFGVQAAWFLSGRSFFKIRHKPTDRKGAVEILKTGYPGALSNIYQAVRGIILNALILQFVGSAGLSSFAASESIHRLFWTIPYGMVVVSRVLMSVSIGEEDRKSLTDVMRVVMYKCIPLMCCVSALIILCAVPFTRMFYRDPSDPVYGMTVNAFRIIPICMPLSIICMHFACYAQTSGKQFLVHLLSLLDGVVCVAGFSALLVPALKMDGVYIAYILNGIVCAIAVVVYSWAVRKRFPRNMEELMVIPDDFGVSENDRIDISVKNISEVMDVSQKVIDFCDSHGIDDHRGRFSGLFLEEMAVNVIEHGFKKDNKKHSVDIRVVHKQDEIILRIKDDCIPFDPAERLEIFDPKDKMKNEGIRMVYKAAKDIRYQNILGLNVLTIYI